MRASIFSLIAMALTCSSTAQSLYNRETTLSINTNTILFVANNIINDGIIINNGDIQVAGLWQNNATYEPGSGQLTLTSSLPQTINHNDQSFTRLTISGGGEKIFGADITIENELVMNDGILKSSGNAKIIIEENASIIGGSETSFIEGPLYHIGTGDKYYPIGVNNVFLPVELTAIQGITPTTGVVIHTPNPNVEVEGALEAVTDQQYWGMDILEGTYESSIIKLPVNNELFLNTIDNAVVAQSINIDTPFTSIGGTNIMGNTMVGSVTSETLATQSLFTIGVNTKEATADINVYNAISPNGDGMHDFLKIENIELYPANNVIIYTRWGDKVFEQSAYDNVENTFVGKSNVGKDRQLLEGTYYYVIEKGNDSKKISGFIVIRY